MKLPKFGIEDKVIHRACLGVGVVTGISKEINYPGKGVVRKITVCFPGVPEAWAWDFELEVW